MLFYGNARENRKEKEKRREGNGSKQEIQRSVEPR
jgi:hypothetical protein